MKRREAREKAIQALYQIDMRGIDAGEALKTVTDKRMNEEACQFLHGLVFGVLRYQEEIDQAIRKFLRGWTLERLPLVDRAVLRLAAYEILYVEEIPVKVSLNEAIELARSFGMEESVKYINAVLASIIKEKNGDIVEVGQRES